MSRHSLIALIPARAGSKRVRDKNVAPLAGHPLLAYTIAAAKLSGLFERILVSTDSPAYADVARYYGAEVPELRPDRMAGDLSPDIEWVEHALTLAEAGGGPYDAFALLRPTSPFRQAGTIRRAWTQFTAEPCADSLRAVEKCRQHPAKMWVTRNNRLLPLLPFGPEAQPWHSSQYPSLPLIYVQNASLEIAWTRVVRETKTIAGVNLIPFMTEGLEGFDVNDPIDWTVAELLVSRGEGSLPPVDEPSYLSSGQPNTR